METEQPTDLRDGQFSKCHNCSNRRDVCNEYPGGCAHKMDWASCLGKGYQRSERALSVRPVPIGEPHRLGEYLDRLADRVDAKDPRQLVRVPVDFLRGFANAARDLSDGPDGCPVCGAGRSGGEGASEAQEASIPTPEEARTFALRDERCPSDAPGALRWAAAFMYGATGHIDLQQLGQVDLLALNGALAGQRHLAKEGSGEGESEAQTSSYVIDAEGPRPTVNQVLEYFQWMWENGEVPWDEIGWPARTDNYTTGQEFYAGAKEVIRALAAQQEAFDGD